MAKFGIIRIGLFILTILFTGFNGFLLTKDTLPAKASGLSNQVFSIGPP